MSASSGSSSPMVTVRDHSIPAQLARVADDPSEDPWREATMSASGLNVASTAEQPIMISDGIHCSDLGASSGRADPTVNAVQQGALKSMATWLAEWKKPAERKRSTGEKRVGPARRADSSSAASDDAKSARPVNAWFKDVGSF